MKVAIECIAYVDQERRVPQPAMAPRGHRITVRTDQMTRQASLTLSSLMSMSREKGSCGPKTCSLTGSISNDRSQAIHEVRQMADTDVRNPTEYHIRRCSGCRLMSLAAEPPPSVRHTTDHRSSLRLSASLPLLQRDHYASDDASNGRLSAGKPDVAQQTLHRALPSDRQKTRLRQGRARLH
jgi:hypothetical protein